MALPNLSDADRQAALKKAAESRAKRAAVRAQIKSGAMGFADVMKKADDPIIARMKVSALLESLPGFGKAKSARIMGTNQIHIKVLLHRARGNLSKRLIAQGASGGNMKGVL